MTTPDPPIRLELSGGGADPTSLAEVNQVLSRVGSRLWPLDLGSEPAGIRALLHQPTLGDAEAKRVEDHFLLSRERLLETITGAGRQPRVPGGGALRTFVLPHAYWYPQLYRVDAGADYSRFDRFHVNVADDGTGVDEVLQILSGGGFVLQQRLPTGEVLTLRLSCPDAEAGWILTYDGDVPHIGSLSSAAPGTKVLVQVIGAERWVMRYEQVP